MNENAISDAKKLADSGADKFANILKGDLESTLGTVRTFAQAFEAYETMPRSLWEGVFLDMQKKILIANPEFIGVATSWELNAIDTGYTKNYGRLQQGYYREGNLIKLLNRKLNTDGDDLEGRYYNLKMSRREYISDPELYSYTGDDDDQVLNSNFSVPIISQEKFVGLAGVDVDLSRFQKLVDEFHPVKNSFSFVVSNSGLIAAHHKNKFINKYISDVYEKYNLQYGMLDNIKRGEYFSFIWINEQGEKFYATFAPVKVNKLRSPWSVAFMIPLQTVFQQARESLFIAIGVGLLGLIILSIIVWISADKITYPIRRTTKILALLAKGEINATHELSVLTRDEIGIIRKSVNALVSSMKRTAQFAFEIRKGNFDAKFESLGKNDVLGQALIDMRESLKQAKAEEIKRQELDNQINWVSTGYAIFSELLRANQDNFAEFSHALIAKLVQYLSANAGAFYLLNDTQESKAYLELTAHYALDEIRVSEKKMELGVSLLGKSIKQAKILQVTEIPENYLNIESGLGHHPPKLLIVAPLIFNNKTYGVIELALFKEIQQFELDFIEKIAENIASTVSNVLISLKTNVLLEESQRKSIEMLEQENMMRENMEQLMNAQENMELSQFEMKANLLAINQIILTVEYTIEGEIIEVNDNFLKTMEYSREEMLGKYILNFIQSEEQEAFWENFEKVKQGKFFKREIKRYTKMGVPKWFLATYTPVYDTEGNVSKVLYFAYNITEEKEKSEQILQQEIKLKRQMNELEESQAALQEIHAMQQERIVNLLQENKQDEKLINKMLKEQEVQHNLKLAKYHRLIAESQAGWLAHLEKAQKLLA